MSLATAIRVKGNGRGKIGGGKPRKPKTAPRQGGPPQQIVAAAFEEFAEKGFAGARLEDVAARAKVSKGLPYLYFKTKVELFKAVIRSVITSHFEVIRERMETTELTIEDFLKGPFLPFLQDLVGSRRAFIVRLLIAEGHKHPELTEFYYENVISRGIETMKRLSIAASRVASSVPRACATFRNCLSRRYSSRSLAFAVRALPSSRYRRAARHQHRSPGRGREGASSSKWRR